MPLLVSPVSVVTKHNEFAKMLSISTIEKKVESFTYSQSHIGLTTNKILKAVKTVYF